MRKLIVLIMTSVLATGAVANADTVNVVKDPADYITIGPILEADGTTPATTLMPSYSTDDADRTFYIMQAEFLNPSQDSGITEGLTLNKASLCLYDPAVVAGGTSLDTLCGSKPDAGQGMNAPDKALQAVVWGAASTHHNSKHVVQGYGSSDFSPNLSGSEMVDSDSNGQDDTRKVSVGFALSHATANTTGWKVRALVQYNVDGSADTVEYQLTDDGNSYDIGAFRTIDTQRTQVTYADVIPGQSTPETGITTGTYFANHTVSINMEATEFTNGSTPVPFSTTDPGENNEFGLQCTLSATTLFVTGTEADLVSSSPASSVGGSEAAKALNTHDCTLKAGGAVEPDSYNNVVTIGIGAPRS